MNQVLGRSAGNALEVQEAIAFLTGRNQKPRLLEVTLELTAELLHLGGLAETVAEGRAKAQITLNSGAAAERFAQMVAALGGPTDVLRQAQLPVAPVQRAVPARRDRVLHHMDLRAIGQVIVALGGGRARPVDRLDWRVGLAQVLPLGTAVRAGDALTVVHAADPDAADAAIRALQLAIELADQAPVPAPLVQRFDEAQ